MPNDTPNGNDQPNLHQRVTTLERARKELEDAMLVHAQLEAAAARRIKERAEWLARHDQELEKDRRRGRELDERIAKLVSAIGEFIRQQSPNNPAH